MAVSRTPRPERARRWIILVARDQPDLYAHLKSAFTGDHKVEVVLDRRENDSRNPAWVNERLRSQGAVIIRRPA
jgi:hypothetical protein